MKQVINPVFHVLHGHARPDLPLSQASDLILMPLLQPFYRVIHFLIPPDLRIEPQAAALRAGYAGKPPRFHRSEFFQMLHPLSDRPLHLLQPFPLLPDLFLFLLQHGQGALHILTAQIFSDLLHRKAQREKIPDDVQPVNILQGIQPVIVLSPSGRKRADPFIIAQGIHPDPVQAGNLADRVIFLHFNPHFYSAIRAICDAPAQIAIFSAPAGKIDFQKVS